MTRAQRRLQRKRYGTKYVPARVRDGGFDMDKFKAGLVSATSGRKPAMRTVGDFARGTRNYWHNRDA